MLDIDDFVRSKARTLLYSTNGLQSHKQTLNIGVSSFMFLYNAFDFVSVKYENGVFTKSVAYVDSSTLKYSAANNL